MNLADLMDEVTRAGTDTILAMHRVEAFERQVKDRTLLRYLACVRSRLDAAAADLQVATSFLKTSIGHQVVVEAARANDAKELGRTLAALASPAGAT